MGGVKIIFFFLSLQKIKKRKDCRVRRRDEELQRIRNSRFDGLSDTIDYYDSVVNDEKRPLSLQQRKQLEEVGKTISVFGEAGNNYYKLSKQLIKQSDKMARSQNLRKGRVKTAAKGGSYT